jgi:DNA-binding transcriptional MerR regulator
MPFKEPTIEKLYYTIGEVSDLFGVNPSLIRFWEKEFEELNPRKNRKGNRLYSQKDLENLRTIYHLVKERGFTLEGARKKLKENPDEVDASAEVVSKLLEIRSFLIDLRDKL